MTRLSSRLPPDLQRVFQRATTMFVLSRLVYIYMVPYVCMRVHVRVCVCARALGRVCVCVRYCMHVRACITACVTPPSSRALGMRVYVYMYVHMCLGVCVYMYMHMHMACVCVCVCVCAWVQSLLEPLLQFTFAPFLMHATCVPIRLQCCRQNTPEFDRHKLHQLWRREASLEVITAASSTERSGARPSLDVCHAWSGAV